MTVVDCFKKMKKARLKTGAPSLQKSCVVHSQPLLRALLSLGIWKRGQVKSVKLIIQNLKKTGWPWSMRRLLAKPGDHHVWQDYFNLTIFEIAQRNSDLLEV